MKTILICNNQMQKIAGSEVHVFELADYFASIGFHVTVASFDLSECFLQKFKSIGVVALNLNDGTFPEDWDIIWTHHVTCFYDIHVRKKLRARKFIHGILSVIVPIEFLPFSSRFYPDSKFFTVYANSSVTKDFVSRELGGGIDVKILRNIAPDLWRSRKINYSVGIKNIAVVSNHPPEEIKALNNSSTSRGLKVDFIGGRGERVIVSPEMLVEYDAVITIGKTVQYCMVAGIPVFVYDYFGGPGWLNQGNLNRAEYSNFNGKCVGRRRSADELVVELFGGYLSAVQYSQGIIDWAFNRYAISKQLESVDFEVISDSASRLIDDDWRASDILARLKYVRKEASRIKWRRRLNRWKKYLLE